MNTKVKVLVADNSAEFGEPCAEAVSYTHLDVYKRQVLVDTSELNLAESVDAVCALIRQRLGDRL